MLFRPKTAPSTHGNHGTLTQNIISTLKLILTASYIPISKASLDILIADWSIQMGFVFICKMGLVNIVHKTSR